MGSKGEESRNVGREAIQDLSHNNGVIWVGMDGGGGRVMDQQTGSWNLQLFH